MSTDVRNYDDDIARIENLVGQLSASQKWEVIDAIDEEREGVMALAEEIGANPKLDVPVAVFISAIRKGKHLGKVDGVVAKRLTPREAFRGFFDEYRSWLSDVADLDDNRCIEFALDYAVSSMSSFTPTILGKPVKLKPYERDQTALTLEDELRGILNRPRPSTSGGDRTRMQMEWILVGFCLHDKGIAEMHHQMMADCLIPRQPSHQEARDARAALVAEVRARGVKPRQPLGPLGGALQEALHLVAR